MGSISQRLLLAALCLSACRTAKEPTPAPIPRASEQPSEPSPAESSGPAPATARAAAPRVYDEKTVEISARVGERFEVALPGNITTPLKWNLDTASMSDLVTLSSQSYSDAPPADCAGCVGYPGTAHFVLDAAQEGSTTLLFAYRKLGQTSGQAKRDVKIKLTVTP